MSRIINSVGILGIGSCLPDKVLTNSDLEKMVETSDEWITKRTGISERRILDKNTPAYELGIKASQAAIKDAGITPEDIDLIMVTTETPDYLVPSMACIIQEALGAKKAAAFDLNAACSGFVYGLTVAKQFISTGYYKHILVVGCEALSKVTDWEDRNTCVLFGDGAGAAVIGPVEEGYGILATDIGAEGSFTITLPCCSLSEADVECREHDNKQVLWMDGGEVFKFAVRVMAAATERVLNDTGMSLEDIKMIFPHQANIRIIEGAAKKLGVSKDKVFTNVHKYGNISSASIPVALDEAVKNNTLSKGDNLVLVGFGGGLTWGSAIVKWSK
ncbi:MAG: ketoacyl-ACP synthase III [Clostridia bacterium]|nr:ketoacyl-ACP synthase III [Clostridia bacterium]